MQDIISKKSIGERLRTLRLSLDLSQAEISETLGLSRSHYSQVELGKQFPSYQVLSRASSFYGKPYEWILHGSNITDVISHAKNILTTDTYVAVSPADKELSLPAAVTDATVLIKMDEYITYQSRRQDAEYIDSLPRLSLPLTQLNSGTWRGFEVIGDDMGAALCHQDVAIGALVDDHRKVILTNPYVILSSQGLSIRRIVNFNMAESTILCVSDHKKYASETIKLSDIYELWEVKAKIAFRMNEVVSSVSQYFQNFENSMTELQQEMQKLKSQRPEIY